MVQIEKFDDPEVRKILYLEAEDEMKAIISCEDVINESSDNGVDQKVRAGAR